MKVLVTGGAGFIGSHACKVLAQRGHEPIVYDNLSRGHAEAVRWGPLEKGDTGDKARVLEVLERHRPAAVMHFASFAYVGESVGNPGLYYRNNTVGSLTLLDAMRDHGVGRIVFSSTCATYGVPRHLPLVEDHPQAPINPYGATKLMVERMLADFDAARLQLDIDPMTGEEVQALVGQLAATPPAIVARLRAALEVPAR